MNSTAFCNGCKRSFSSLEKLVRHCKKQKCGTSQAVGVPSINDRTQTDQPSLQSTARSVDQHAEQPVDQPVASNISSPMADPSPIEEDLEPLAGIVAYILTLMYSLCLLIF